MLAVDFEILSAVLSAGQECTLTACEGEKGSRVGSAAATLLHAPQQRVVRLVRADPEAVEIVICAIGDGAIRPPHVDRSDFALLLQSQRWMKWVRVKERELLVRKRLNLGR